MPNLSDHIRDFATKLKISTREWTISATDTVLLLIGGIRSNYHAKALSEYLAKEGMLVAVTMGDKQGATWVVMARLSKMPVCVRRLNNVALGGRKT